MYQYQLQIRVRYAETDQMGYVYYGNYATYYEIARVEAFRNLGFSYKELEETGIGMPVVELVSRFHYPVKYDDLITITVTVPEQPRASIRFTYEIRNQDEKVVNSGETTLVFINLGSGRPTRLPQKLHDVLNPWFE